MAKDLPDGFGDWDELCDALRPKSTKGRKVKGWHVHKAVVARARGRSHRQKANRAKKKFVATVVDGPSNRSRPRLAAAIELANEAQRTGKPGRWMELLRDMGPEVDWTMKALCGLFDRDVGTTHATVKRYLMDRGFVARTANPNARFGSGEHANRYCNRNRRPFADRWLYRRTELGGRVVAGEVEWRKVRTYKRWKYRAIKQRNAAARGEQS